MQARGYFGIGVEQVSKPMNFGNLSRTAYGFGASFVFTVAATEAVVDPASDTGASYDHMPWYAFDAPHELQLPTGCALVGVERTDDAIELPSFRHPQRAAYVLGPEGGSLSAELTERAEFVVKIPTRFCLNVATAGAVVMYDRLLTMGRFADRPVKPGGPTAARPDHVHGKPIFRTAKRLR